MSPIIRSGFLCMAPNRFIPTDGKDQRWQQARARASRQAVAHFACRDATDAVVLAYIHRETLRLLGEPVTALWHGWNRPRRGLAAPEMPAELRERPDQQQRRPTTTKERST